MADRKPLVLDGSSTKELADEPIVLRAPDRQIKIQESDNGDKEYYIEVGSNDFRIGETSTGAKPFTLGAGLPDGFAVLNTIANANQVYFGSNEGLRLVLEADKDNIDESDTARVVFLGDGGFSYGVVGHTGTTNLDADGNSMLDAVANDLTVHAPNSAVSIGARNKTYMRVSDLGNGTVELIGELAFDAGPFLKTGDLNHGLCEFVDDALRLMSGDVEVCSSFGEVKIGYKAEANIGTSMTSGETVATFDPISGQVFLGDHSLGGLLKFSNDVVDGVADIWTDSDTSLRITNSGTGSTGASLQLKGSGSNYLFSFEGRGGFRYYSRVSGAEKFKVDDTGQIIANNGAVHEITGSTGVSMGNDQTPGNCQAALHIFGAGKGEENGIKWTGGNNNWNLFVSDGNEGAGDDNDVVWTKNNQISVGGNLRLLNTGEIAVPQELFVGYVDDVGTAAPTGNGSLTVRGQLNFRGISSVTSASYNVSSTDFTILADATSNNVTITLPSAASSNGRILNIKRIDSTANTVTVEGAGNGQNIDGTLSALLNSQYESITIQCNGTEWYII